MNTSLKFVIADDHVFLLNGLHQALEEKGHDVLGIAKDGIEAVNMILLHQPDIALLDIDMPLLTGFDVIKMARVKTIKTKFVVLSFHKELEYIALAKSIGISGYLLKEDSIDELDACIKAIQDNEEYFSTSLQKISLKEVDSTLKNLNLLTPSECQILKFIAEEYDTNKIAMSLHVSERTIEKHRSNIIRKINLEVKNNTLGQWALKNQRFLLEYLNY